MTPRMPLIHLVEDDLIIAENIRETLVELGYPEVLLSHTYDEARQAFARTMPDLLLLDIRLDRSDRDGTDLSRELTAIKPVPVLYLSAHTDDIFQRRAFATGPANFLVKPVSRDQLRVAIFGALQQREKMTDADKPTITSDSPHFFVKSHGRYVRITPENLIYAKAAGSYCEVFTTEGKYTLSMNLGAFLEKCRKFNHVSKCHRSYAVNTRYILAYDAKQLYLQAAGLEVSIPYGPEFREKR